MSDLAYSHQEWLDSYEQAEISEFTDGPDLHDWPLSQFMCGVAETSETVKADTRIMQALINMLETEEIKEFSPEFFITVLGTANGNTVEDFQELTHQWVSENLGPEEDGRPDQENFSGSGDWEIWYLDNAVRSTEVYGEIKEGGTLFWFDRGNTW